MWQLLHELPLGRLEPLDKLQLCLRRRQDKPVPWKYQEINSVKVEGKLSKAVIVGKTGKVGGKIQSGLRSRDQTLVMPKAEALKAAGLSRTKDAA